MEQVYETGDDASGYNNKGWTNTSESPEPLKAFYYSTDFPCNWKVNL